MTELLSLTENLGHSRPVFELKLREDGFAISINEHRPIHKFALDVQDGDILGQLIVNNYKENFDKHTKTFDINKPNIARSAMNQIRESFPTFLEKNLKMKSPKQSKIYRWTYRNMPRTTEFEDVLVMVYKYMRTFCHSNMIAHGENKEEHIKNTIALLEALQEKHGQ
jgi:hypothetical protein